MVKSRVYLIVLLRRLLQEEGDSRVLMYCVLFCVQQVPGPLRNSVDYGVNRTEYIMYFDLMYSAHFKIFNHLQDTSGWSGAAPSPEGQNGKPSFNPRSKVTCKKR